MADATTDDQQQPDSEETEEKGQEQKSEKPEPQTFNVFGREMTADDAVEELRRSQSEITRLQQQAKQADTAPERVAAEQEASSLDEQSEEARKQLKALGFTDTKDVDKLVSERVEKLLGERENEQTTRSEISRLKEKYDGKGLIPKFNEYEVLNYAGQNGFGPSQIELAFEQMHKGDFIEHYKKQADKKQSAVTDTSDAPAQAEFDGDKMGKELAAAASDTIKQAAVLKKYGTGPGTP